MRTSALFMQPLGTSSAVSPAPARMRRLLRPARPRSRSCRNQGCATTPAAVSRVSGFGSSMRVIRFAAESEVCKGDGNIASGAGCEG